MTQTTIVTADQIITMADDAPEAVAVTDGRVSGTGRLAELRERHAGAEVMDFGRAVIVPGFHDAHLHLGSAADQLMHVDQLCALPREQSA